MLKYGFSLAFIFYAVGSMAQQQPDKNDFNVAYFVRFSELESLLIPIDTNELKKISIDEIQSLEMIHENVESVMGKHYHGQSAVMILVLTAKGERTFKGLKKIGVIVGAVEEVKLAFVEAEEKKHTKNTFRFGYRLSPTDIDMFRGN